MGGSERGLWGHRELGPAAGQLGSAMSQRWPDMFPYARTRNSGTILAPALYSDYED